VRVAGGQQLVGGGVGGPGQHFGQRFTSGRRRAGDVVRVHHVHHALEGTEDLVPPWQFGGQLVHEAAERQTSCWSSHTVRFSSAMAMLPRRYCGSFPRWPCPRMEWGRSSSPGQRRDWRLPPRRSPRPAAAQQLQRDVLVAGRDGLDDAAVRAPGDSLALEAGISVVNPRSTTTSTSVSGAVPQASGTSPWSRSHLVLHGFPHAAPCSCGWKSWRMASRTGTGSSGTSQLLKLQGHAAPIDGGGDPFAEKAVQADFRDPAVVVQCVPL
jgi:hypothetical protein